MATESGRLSSELRVSPMVTERAHSLLSQIPRRKRNDRTFDRQTSLSLLPPRNTNEHGVYRQTLTRLWISPA